MKLENGLTNLLKNKVTNHLKRKKSLDKQFIMKFALSCTILKYIMRNNIIFPYLSN